MPAKGGGARWFPYRLRFVVGDAEDAGRPLPDQAEPEGGQADREPDGGQTDRAEPDGDQADRDEPHIYIDTTDVQAEAAAVGAAVAHVLERPDTIRHRAQNAAAISSALAAALVIAALSQLTGSGPESWEMITVVFVLLAVAAWAISVALYIHAVTHIDRERTPKVVDYQQLIDDHAPQVVDYQQLINDYERYSGKLRRALKRAARFSGLALLLTLVAIVLEVGERVRSVKDPRQLVLSEEGVAAVAELCGWDKQALKKDPRINGRLAAHDLSRPIVLVLVASRPLSPNPERCTPRRRSNTIRLPRSTILGTRDLGPD